MIFRFYCDVSFDGSSQAKTKGQRHLPRTLVVAGITAHEDIWKALEGAWARTNASFGVPRFHASHLNSRTYEYQGWDNAQKLLYSRTMLHLLSMCGRELGIVSSGIYADDYRNIISPDGQKKFGTPYVACFNSCITGLAQLMRNNPADDKFAVILDKDEGWHDAQDAFYWLKDESSFVHRDRLLSCTSFGMEDAVCLQAADLVAYEMYKATARFREGHVDRRYPMKSLLKHNLVKEGYYDKSYLEMMKPWVEATVCTGKYLIHTPMYSKNQVEIPEELDPFNTAMDKLLKADPRVIKAVMEQERQEREAERRARKEGAK